MATCKFVILVAVLALVGFVSAGGRKDYGDECSITGQISNIFTSDASDDPEACNTDKKLICGVSRTCSCRPGHVYEKSGILSVFSGGECVVAANFPCSKDSKCAAYSECGGVCRCDEGYQAKEGHCTNSSGRVSISVFYLLALVASYFVFMH